MNNLLTSFITYIRTSPIETLIFLLFLIAIVTLFRLHWKTQIDDNWDQFVIEHNCKVIKKEGSNNHRTGWICDDGEEYYRWRQQV